MRRFKVIPEAAYKEKLDDGHSKKAWALKTPAGASCPAGCGHHGLSDVPVLPTFYGCCRSMDQINLLAISWNVRVLTLARALREDVV